MRHSIIEEATKKMHKLFKSKENRDAFWRSLPAELRRFLRRTSSRNQLLHPMYVEDWPRELKPEEKGFGNVIYKTYFSRLYTVEHRFDLTRDEEIRAMELEAAL